MSHTNELRTNIPAPVARRRTDMTPIERQALDAANNLAAQAATNRSLEKSAANRPPNTTSQYAPNQEEYEDWCLNARQWADGVIVTEHKLLLFLQEFVESRGNKKKRKADTAEPAELKLASYDQYANAVIDLYRTI